MKPQIFIYPVQEMSAYENVGNIAADLEALLQSQQPGRILPYLPLYNAGQVMHAQVKFLDFQSGSGVRYLTQFDQALLPINNDELLYTYQGLTSDGRFYVAAVLPVKAGPAPQNLGNYQHQQSGFQIRGHRCCQNGPSTRGVAIEQRDSAPT